MTLIHTQEKLHCTALHCTALHCTALIHTREEPLLGATVHSSHSGSHPAPRPLTALHCTALHCTALHPAPRPRTSRAANLCRHPGDPLSRSCKNTKNLFQIKLCPTIAKSHKTEAFHQLDNLLPAGLLSGLILLSYSAFRTKCATFCPSGRLAT